MRAFVLKDNIIENVIEVESLDFMDGLVEAYPGGDIGQEYNPPPTEETGDANAAD